MANQGCLGFLVNLFGMSTQNAPTPLGLPYRTRDSLMRSSEHTFFQALQSAVGDRYIIFSMVRLADIFEVKPYDQGAQNRILPMHVDFLLCDPASLRPIAAIELDGDSHLEPKQQRRDQFKDAVFKHCGLPLLRFQVRPPYDPHEIRSRLQLASTARISYEVASPRRRNNEPVAPTPIVGGRKPPK